LAEATDAYAIYRRIPHTIHFAQNPACHQIDGAWNKVDRFSLYGHASFDTVGTGRMAADERVRKYRRNAEKCLELANAFNDPESKRALLVMANAWLMLAEQNLKNREVVLVYETLTPQSKPDPQDE
jgi:hypothetical protein